MIQGIGNSDLYGAYNRISYTRQAEEALKSGVQNQNSAEKAVAQQSAPAPVMDLKLDSIRPRVNASIEDISLSLSTKPSFEMKGRESDINALDINRAVSDMQKDEALMQYQYFVGDQQPVFSSEDGMVFAKAGL